MSSEEKVDTRRKAFVALLIRVANYYESAEVAKIVAGRYQMFTGEISRTQSVRYHH